MYKHSPAPGTIPLQRVFFSKNLQVLGPKSIKNHYLCVRFYENYSLCLYPNDI